MGLQCVRNGGGGPHPGAWPVHHDAAIHVTPTPGSAGALAGTVSQDATQSDFPNISLIRPAVPSPCTTMRRGGPDEGCGVT